MLRFLFLLLIAAVTGCAVSDVQHCSDVLRSGVVMFGVAAPDSSFVQITEPSPLHAELLQLSSDKYSTQGFSIKLAATQKEAWFETGENTMQLCRYDNVRSTCLDNAESIVFIKSGGSWGIGGHMTSSECERSR